MVALDPDTAQKWLLRPPTLAKRLDITTRTLRRWVSDGTFPPPDLKHGPKLMFWRAETVQQWIADKAGKSLDS